MGCIQRTMLYVVSTSVLTCFCNWETSSHFECPIRLWKLCDSYHGHNLKQFSRWILKNLHGHVCCQSASEERQQCLLWNHVMWFKLWWKYSKSWKVDSCRCTSLFPCIISKLILQQVPLQNDGRFYIIGVVLPSLIGCFSRWKAGIDGRTGGPGGPRPPTFLAGGPGPLLFCRK